MYMFTLHDALHDNIDNASPISTAVLKGVTSSFADLRLPNEGDLSGAAQALVRLQDTYQLDTFDFARGEIPGSSLGRELTAWDCFVLGRECYFLGDFGHARPWLEEAWHRSQREALIAHSPLATTLIGGPPLSPAQPLEYLAFATYRLGDTARALALTRDLLQVDPAHKVARDNVVAFERELQEMKRKADVAKPDLPSMTTDDVDHVSESLANHLETENRLYRALCRGHLPLAPSVLKRLRCYYSHNGVAFLRLRPVPTEDLYLDPHIVLFHDVMHDSEIEAIKNVSAPLLQRATIRNVHTGELETANYRISKSAWLNSRHHNAVTRSVERRVAQLTGLSLNTAEELQVVNYGIGGHYEPHSDYTTNKAIAEQLEDGNRIATFIFYMSDVAAGGATVFTQLGAVVKPRRGSAAFWYNLHADGSGDWRTRHAACPVLVGSKWVANKWFHEHDNEFRRPCRLQPDL
ncbi:prolyl 4-hydroxylase subunit alpha-1-like [Pollicipes pollicipes]|uniref:prolyl 4-hydroxylase subunit alpha-1-like n=1 Tax=Pollicipes pollicipes TaxID=41117 RepID=UPI00188597C1|nr:prolyl 4-hydroxylase subunit alpha-1-like [Pollicipes pollicipes]